MNSTCICRVFKMKSLNFTGTSATFRDRSWKGWRFYCSLIWVRNKGLITQKTWIRRAFAQFSRWRVETSQERRRLLETGRGGWPFYCSSRAVVPNLWPAGQKWPARPRKVALDLLKNFKNICATNRQNSHFDRVGQWGTSRYARYGENN